MADKNTDVMSSSYGFNNWGYRVPMQLELGLNSNCREAAIG